MQQTPQQARNSATLTRKRRPCWVFWRSSCGIWKN